MAKQDDNWKETKILTEDLSSILNKSPSEISLILKSLENLIIHKFLELYLEDESHKNHDYSIELPYLGTLIISFEREGQCVFNFTPRQVFVKKIKSSYNSGTSPLTDQFTEILSNKLLNLLEGGESVGK